MATSHLKGGQIQRQEQTKRITKKEEGGGGGRKKEGETRDVRAGDKASDVLLFQRDCIRGDTLHRALQPTASVSSFSFMLRTRPMCYSDLGRQRKANNSGRYVVV